jgi:predicted transcriptional regulator
VARVTNRRVALLSVHPRFASAIFAGDKSVELRRSRVGSDISHVVVYATSPVRKVVGWFEVGGVERDAPSRLWRRHRLRAGITASEFRAYFRGAAEGTAISVRRVVVLERPLPLADFGANLPPQSFRYIDDAFLADFDVV